MAKIDKSIKISVLGFDNSEVKSFMKKISRPLFESDAAQSIGADFFVQTMSFNKQIYKILFWVILYNEKFKFLYLTYIKNTDGLIYLLNLSKLEAYHDAKNWISRIQKEFKQLPILLIGYFTNNKEIPDGLNRSLLSELNIYYIEISLDNEVEVKNSIIYLACLIMKIQIPYAIQQKLSDFSYILPDSKYRIDKEPLIPYVEVSPSIEIFKYSCAECLEEIRNSLDDPNLQLVAPHLDQLKKKINSMKGRFLEINSRLLFERGYGYKVDLTGKDLECRTNEIEFLYSLGCIKNLRQKDIEIDIYGKKSNYGSDITYLIGECKDRKKKISPKKIKCFIAKARIVADFYLDIHKRKKKAVPKFHLVIISLHGFPNKEKIDKILEDTWKKSIPKKRILGERIDLIDKKKFEELLRRNNIPIYDI